MNDVFGLSESWQKVIMGAGSLDGQSVADVVEAAGPNTPDKVAEMAAVVEKIMGEIESLKSYRTKINEQIDRAEANAEQIRGYILEAVEEIGEPKPDAPEFKIVRIEGRPWIKSAWTELRAPRIEVVDERIIDEAYKKPRPAEIDLQRISKDWTGMADTYRAERRAYILALKDEVEAGTKTDAEARQALHEYHLSKQPQISGISIKQPKGVNFQ